MGAALDGDDGRGPALDCGCEWGVALNCDWKSQSGNGLTGGGHFSSFTRTSVGAVGDEVREDTSIGAIDREGLEDMSIGAIDGERLEDTSIGAIDG